LFSDRYIALGKWVKGVAASIAIIVKKNCIWKIVVRRMQDVRCMTSITPCAEEKENFCLLTMQLWLSKSNSV